MVIVIHVAPKAVMLKFIPTDAAKLGQKRKQCQKACEVCRRKKKRCSHVDNPQLSSNSVGSQEGFSDNFHDARIDPGFHSPAAEIAPQDGRQEPHAPHLDEEVSHSRTVEGASDHLNSTAASHPLESNDQERIQRDTPEDAEPELGSRFIGDLNPEGMFLAATSPGVTIGADQADRIGIWLTERLSKRRGSLISLPEQVKSNLFYGFDPLIQKVMIPLLAEECLALLPPQLELQKLCSIYFDKHHPIFPVIDEQSFWKMNSTEPASVLLKQGICLVASLNLSAKGYLRLPKESKPLNPREFGRRISAAMRTSVELGLVTKKDVIIQALALLSFFIEGPSGGDLSSQVCGRAVHYIHSIGLHIKSRRQGQYGQYAETLLCCIWALDRLNAALHGRPVLMHERDLGRDLDACFLTQNVCFRLFLRVIKLLDDVICLYRPSNERDVGSLAEFPLFEEILEEIGGSQIPTPLLATIETLYHAIAILSCRTKFPSEPQFSSTSYLQQNYSAIEITSIAKNELRNHLSLFPFVPYAVSLSLSVAYREMRHTKIAMYRARARSAMIRICEILQEIGEVSWSAEMMAEMGKATLKEMDRVYNEVASGRQRRNGQERRTESPDPQAELHTRARTETLAPVPDHEAVFPTPDTSWASMTDNNNSYGPLADIPADMPDFDVFAFFDPNFDLDGIDALLGGNLDMSMPSAF